MAGGRFPQIVKTAHPTQLAKSDWWIESEDGERDGPYDTRKDAKFIMDYRARSAS